MIILSKLLYVSRLICTNFRENILRKGVNLRYEALVRTPPFQNLKKPDCILDDVSFHLLSC